MLTRMRPAATLPEEGPGCAAVRCETLPGDAKAGRTGAAAAGAAKAGMGQKTAAAQPNARRNPGLTRLISRAFAFHIRRLLPSAGMAAPYLARSVRAVEEASAPYCSTDPDEPTIYGRDPCATPW